MKKSNVDVIETVGKYQVIKYYADTLYTNNDKENGVPYYGDIYTSRDEVLQNHPNAEVLEGFGVLDTETGYSPDDVDDWYDTVEDVLDFIKEQ